MIGPLRFGQEIFLMSIIQPEDFFGNEAPDFVDTLYERHGDPTFGYQ